MFQEISIEVPRPRANRPATNLLLQPDDACPFLLEEALIFLRGRVVKCVAYVEFFAEGGGAAGQVGGRQICNDGLVPGGAVSGMSGDGEGPGCLTALQLAEKSGSDSWRSKTDSNAVLLIWPGG